MLYYLLDIKRYFALSPQFPTVEFHLTISFTSLHPGSQQTTSSFLKLNRKQVRKSHNCMLSLHLLTLSPAFAPISILCHSCVSERCVLAAGSHFALIHTSPYISSSPCPIKYFLFQSQPMSVCQLSAICIAPKNTSLPYSVPFCIYHSF